MCSGMIVVIVMKIKHSCRARPKSFSLASVASLIIAAATYMYIDSIFMEEGVLDSSALFVPSDKEVLLSSNIESPPPTTKHRIPRRLIFTYKWNILERKEPLHFYENIQHSIQAYQKAWNVSQAEVSFLDNEDCRKEIQAVKPELVPHFERERNGSFKGDLCRIAALYRNGGYYMDIDLEVIRPVVIPSHVGFATAYEASQKGFFQAFLASESHSKILEKNLDILLEYYVKRFRFLRDLKLGPETMKKAYEAVLKEEAHQKDSDFTTSLLRNSSLLLTESDLQGSPSLFRELSRRNWTGCCCNYVVHDADQAYFFSRIIGAGPFCPFPSK